MCQSVIQSPWWVDRSPAGAISSKRYDTGVSRIRSADGASKKRGGKPTILVTDLTLRLILSSVKIVVKRSAGVPLTAILRVPCKILQTDAQGYLRAPVSLHRAGNWLRKDI